MKWTIGLLVAALGCNGEDTEDTGDTGPHECGDGDLDACEYESPGLTYTERDAQVTYGPAPGRTIPVRIRLPEGDGPFPVVVYSHGGGLNDIGHTFSVAWADALASHGYITVNIGHATLTQEEATAFCTLGQVPESECTAGLLGEGSGMIALIKRTDVVAVVDELPALAAAAEAQGGPEVDVEHIAVVDWSAGSRSTMTSVGAAFYPSPGAPLYSEVDTRIDTVVAFSPTGPGFGGFWEDSSGDSWDTMEGPSLMATGENDVKPDNPDLTGPIRREAYENQPADGTRRLLYSNLDVGVGGHSTYNLEDLESTDERLSRFSRSLRSAVRAFLDDTLLGDTDARAWLESGDAVTLGGDVDWESK